MEDQLITITIKTTGETCEMNTEQIRAWYQQHIEKLFNPEYGKPEITVDVRRTPRS